MWWLISFVLHCIVVLVTLYKAWWLGRIRFLNSFWRSKNYGWKKRKFFTLTVWPDKSALVWNEDWHCTLTIMKKYPKKMRDGDEIEKLRPCEEFAMVNRQCKKLNEIPRASMSDWVQFLRHFCIDRLSETWLNSGKSSARPMRLV